MNETLSVAAIRNGTVIDHIDSGQALRIINLLSMSNNSAQMTIGLHLPSKRLGTKDLIKIENRTLTEAEACEIVVLSPYVTINIIENFELVKKISTRLPKQIQKIFACTNPACITQVEPIESNFHVKGEGKQIKLTCVFCEKIFDRDQLNIKI